jgi:hypothetical protein
MDFKDPGLPDLDLSFLLTREKSVNKMVQKVPNPKDAKAVTHTYTPSIFIKPKEISHLFSRFKVIKIRKILQIRINTTNRQAIGLTPLHE